MSDVQVNTDIRNRVLLFLYDKYYEGEFHDPQIADKILSQIGIAKDLLETAYWSIIYLEKAGYIHGETPLGTPCPMWINIEPLGIDFVERLNSRYTDLHWNIRFEILANLYRQYFSGKNQGKLAGFKRNSRNSKQIIIKQISSKDNLILSLH